MVCGRNPCASGRLGNCHRLEAAADSRRARNADSSVRPGFLGRGRPLRKTRPAQIRRAVPRGARGKSCAAKVTRAGTVETPWHARRAGRRDYRADRTDDGRARHQPYETGRADPWGEEELREEQSKVDSRELKVHSAVKVSWQCRQVELSMSGAWRTAPRV